MIYFSVDDLLEAHDIVSGVSVACSGIRDKAMLDGILQQIEMEYYPDFVSKLTHLVFALNKGHAFLDGNKRTAIMAGALFMLVNDFPEDDVERFIFLMRDKIIEVADGTTKKTELEKWLRQTFNPEG